MLVVITHGTFLYDPNYLPLLPVEYDGTPPTFLVMAKEGIALAGFFGPDPPQHLFDHQT